MAGIVWRLIAVLIVAAIVPVFLYYGSMQDIVVLPLFLGVSNAIVGLTLRVLSYPTAVLTFGLVAIVSSAGWLWFAAVADGHMAIGVVSVICVTALVVSTVNLAFSRLAKA